MWAAWEQDASLPANSDFKDEECSSTPVGIFNNLFDSGATSITLGQTHSESAP